MAKRATASDTSGDGSARRGRGFVKKKVTDFVGRIENVQDEIASEQGAYMKTCRTLREDIDGIYEEAKNAGVKKKVLKAAIDKRILDRKRDAIRDKLEGEDQDDFDNLELALGSVDEDETPSKDAAEQRPAAH